MPATALSAFLCFTSHELCEVSTVVIPIVLIKKLEARRNDLPKYPEFVIRLIRQAV